MVNGFVVLAVGLDMFRLWTIATGRKMNLSGNCPLQTGLWLDGCLGVEPRGMRSFWLKANATLGGGDRFSKACLNNI
jgi:hypothetical protein